MFTMKLCVRVHFLLPRGLGAPRYIWKLKNWKKSHVQIEK